jgi:hypothetical protein
VKPPKKRETAELLGCITVLVVVLVLAVWVGGKSEQHSEAKGENHGAANSARNLERNPVAHAPRLAAPGTAADGQGYQDLITMHTEARPGLAPFVQGS